MEVEFRNVRFGYEGLPVLMDVTCRIRSGETVLLTGITGAGKTTFLKLLYGALQPQSGDVLLDGVLLSSLRKSQIRQIRRDIGIAFQDVRLVPEWTVEENLLFVMDEKIPESEKKRRIIALLSELQLSHLRTKFPEDLSKGEYQLIGTARAILREPRLLIADEPTAHLDLLSMQQLITVLKKAAENRTTIIATHHPEIIAAFPDARLFHIDEQRLYILKPRFAGVER